MSVLFGHPTGNPNSHHAALAHLEAGWLEAFVVPWMPTPNELGMLKLIPRLGGAARRLERRYFPPLFGAPRVEGRHGEWLRMLRRVAAPAWADERLSYQANDWVMRVMKRECRRPAVSAVHSYEDCSLWQFEEAKQLGKLCVYDMPIGYYPAWEEKQRHLAKRYAEWLPTGGLPSSRYVRPSQKKREMELADLVLAPSTFVIETIKQFNPYKQSALAMYGVDLEFWKPSEDSRTERPLVFLYAGQISIRKGTPVLLEAWQKAGIKDAQLHLVGQWALAPQLKAALPPGVRVVEPCAPGELRRHYQAADVFVFPSFFEGFGLVILEALACGLPVITTEATAGVDILDEQTGHVVTAGRVEELVEALRWYQANRDRLPVMRRAARLRAEDFTWERYRNSVRAAVEPALGRAN